MPKRVSKKNIQPTYNDGGLISPKANYYGSLADYKESMTKDSINPDPQLSNNTTFVSNQTGDYYDKSGRPGGARFIKNLPVFPEPQSIKNMPTQFAGFTDYARKDEDLHRVVLNLPQNTSGRRINVKGKPAVGVRIDHPGSLQDFLNTKSVLVNPEYKDPYDKIGNDPDSKDRSRSPLIVPEERQETLRAMGLGISKWAEATSKYFNKPFVVSKSPVQSNQADAPLTTRVQILGEEAGDDYAGGVFMGGSYTPRTKKVLKAPGGENRITPTKALRKEMYLNTDISVAKYGYTASDWAHTTQHEFGHTMGIGHPQEDPKGTTLNSELSYDAPRYEATILPATINAYKKVMDMNYGYTGVDERDKKMKKQAAAQNKLKKLNEKYEKNQRFKSVYDN